jgi:hypothetical protein
VPILYCNERQEIFRLLCRSGGSASKHQPVPCKLPASACARYRWPQ